MEPKPSPSISHADFLHVLIQHVGEKGRAGASALPQKTDGDKQRDQSDLQFHRRKNTFAKYMQGSEMMEAAVRHHPSLSFYL